MTRKQLKTRSKHYHYIDYFIFWFVAIVLIFIIYNN